MALCYLISNSQDKIDLSAMRDIISHYLRSHLRENLNGNTNR